MVASKLMVPNHYRPNQHYQRQLSDNSIVVLNAKTSITCICTTWRHSQSPGWWCKKTLGCNPLPLFRKLRGSWHSVVFSEGVKCPSFHTQFLERFDECVVLCIFACFSVWRTAHSYALKIWSVWYRSMRFGTQLLSLWARIYGTTFMSYIRILDESASLPKRCNLQFRVKLNKQTSCEFGLFFTLFHLHKCMKQDHNRGSGQAENSQSCSAPLAWLIHLCFHNLFTALTNHTHTPDQLLVPGSHGRFNHRPVTQAATTVLHGLFCQSHSVRSGNADWWRRQTARRYEAQ